MFAARASFRRSKLDAEDLLHDQGTDDVFVDGQTGRPAIGQHVEHVAEIRLKGHMFLPRTVYAPPEKGGW